MSATTVGASVLVCPSCGRRIPKPVVDRARSARRPLRCDVTSGGCGRSFLSHEVISLLPMPESSIENALGLLKQRFRGEVDQGTRCPCCCRFAKRYKRQLHSGMAVWLIRLCRLSPSGGWVHASDVLRSTGSRARWSGLDCTKLIWWGLIEPRPDDPDPDADKKKPGGSGYWRPTEAGRLFASNQKTVPKYVFLFNKKCEGSAGPSISIVDALGKKFDYAKLMARTP